MTSLQIVINDLMELKGAKVIQFGQPITLADAYEENEINTIEMLTSLLEYEVNFNDEVDGYDVNDWNEFFENYCKEVACNNSYNWSGNTRNHINYYMYTDGCYYYVEMSVQRGFGDVRGNYTDAFYLKFDNDYEFYETLSDASLTFFERDGIMFSTDIFREGWDAYRGADDAECTIYDYDIDSMVEEFNSKNGKLEEE